jgi:aspartyl-tRNA(Asn)/glutamyl-tRNA(Gln) amidotransferase subunit A
MPAARTKKTASKPVASQAAPLRGPAAVKASLAAVERENKALNALCIVTADEALGAAKALATETVSRSPLHGLPIVVKDIIDMEGHPTRGGSLTRAQVAPAEQDAPVVARLRRAGAVIVGKTNTVEFALGGYGTNLTVGTPRNPWDRKVHRTPGGSSSGTGAAIGGGLVPAGLGTDTGGSVRIPAAMCGCVGLKTSIGLVGRSGVLPLSTTLDTIGPLASSVRLAAEMLAVMQGYDAADPSTHGVAPIDPVSALDRGIAGFRLGRFADEDLPHMTAAVREAYQAAIMALAKAGATVVPFKAPLGNEEVARRCGRLISVEGYALWQHFIDDAKAPLAEPVRARFLAGKRISGVEYYKTQQQRRNDIADFLAAMDRLDALVLPTAPVTALPITAVDETTSLFATNTRFGNYLDLCGLSVPMGLDPDGLPIGLQIVGRRFHDPLVLRIGQAYEAMRGPFPTAP